MVFNIFLHFERFAGKKQKGVESSTVFLSELDSFFAEALQQRQCKKDSIQSKIILALKLPRFFPHLLLGGEKARQFQSWIFFD